MNKKRYDELQQVANRLALALDGGAPLRKHVRTASRKDIADVKRLLSWWSPNIAGFGFGPKEAGEERGTRVALRVYVYRKLHVSRVRTTEQIPKSIHLDYLEEQLRTDVEEVQSEPVLHAALPAGSEVGHFTGSVGTAGCYVQKAGFDGPLLLSCAHVLAPFRAAVDDPIESPVDNNSSMAHNPVGRLTPSAIFLRANGTHITDAALARLNAETVASNNAIGVGPITSILLTPQRLGGLTVEMRGAATGTRVRGFVAPDLLVAMNFRLRGQTYRIQNLMRYTIRARVGDSGAAVVQSGTGRMVGIHVGAEQGTDRAFFAPSWVISAALGGIRPWPV